MTIIYMRPVSWRSVTPRQWGSIRAMIEDVRVVAFSRGNQPLFQRAMNFLDATEGYDV
jgi:hypothetical protein